MKIKIFNKSKPFFIAEISANHKGSLIHAKKLILFAKKSGADAVKLQTYTPSSMTLNSKKSYFKIDSRKWGKKYLWDLYKKAMTPLIWHKKLFDYAKKIKIICFSTPFDEKSVDFLEKLNCSLYKISSFESNHFPLLKRLAKTKKPLIMSTGTSTLNQIRKSVNFLKKNNSGKLHLLYCVSNYPSKVNDFNLNNISILKKEFNLTVGFSDHSNEDFISFFAVQKGADIIEKHITFDAKAIDGKFSKKIKDLKIYISNLKKIKLLKEKPKYTLPKNNTGYKYRRSIFVVENLMPGDIITKKNIQVVRPNKGIDASNYYSLIGKKIKKRISKNSPLLSKHIV
jgi:pseudaminic acid synthase